MTAGRYLPGAGKSVSTDLPAAPEYVPAAQDEHALADPGAARQCAGRLRRLALAPVAGGRRPAARASAEWDRERRRAGHGRLGATVFCIAIYRALRSRGVKGRWRQLPLFRKAKGSCLVCEQKG